MTMWKRLTVLVCLTLALVHTAAAQSGRQGGQLNYSYTRFDQITKALFDEYLPPVIYDSLLAYQLHPRILPVYLTAKDANFDDPDGPVTHKILYGVDGFDRASLMIFEKSDDGSYTLMWRTADAPPARRVRLFLRDVTGDGRPEVIATAHDGIPVFEAMTIYEYSGGRARNLVPQSIGITNPKSVLGIGIAIFDSLGQNGYPAIEVWQDLLHPQEGKYVRVRHQYADSTGKFQMATVDTLGPLPFWCKKRRLTDAEKKPRPPRKF